MDFSAILSAKYSDKVWQLVGNEYQNITWYEETEKPSKAELEELWPIVQYELEYEVVEKTRQQAYQQTADPLFFKWQAGSGTKEEWESERQRIKDANPYPLPLEVIE